MKTKKKVFKTERSFKTLTPKNRIPSNLEVPSQFGDIMDDNQ